KPLKEAQFQTDAAFKKLRALKPNLLTVYTQMPQAFNLLEQGEAWMIGGGQAPDPKEGRRQRGAGADGTAKEGAEGRRWGVGPGGSGGVKTGRQREVAGR